MHTPTHLIHAFCAIFLAALCSTASAQCTPQWTSDGGLPGVNGAVTCSTVWDHGGAPLLVVGGTNIKVAGQSLVQNVAAFDGSTWQPLGMNAPPVVAMTTYAGELIACHYGTGVLRAWNGQSWHALADDSMHGTIAALTVYHGELIVGGQSLNLPGSSVHRLARWNGSTWRDLGALPYGGNSPQGVFAMTVYNDELIIAGRFNQLDSIAASNIARWDGTEWRPLGGGLQSLSSGDTAVSCLAVSGDELIVGGTFSSAGGVAGTSRIARWNGSSWLPFGAPLLGGTPRSITVHNGQVFVGGDSGSISRWTGSAWLNSGGPMTLLGSTAPTVRTLSDYQGTLFAGGDFEASATNPVPHIARWDGASWLPVGSGWCSNTDTLTVYQGEAIVSGCLARADGPPIRIAAWNGSTWRSLDGPEPLTLWSAVVYHSELIGSGFIAPGGPFQLWRWTGSTWQPLSTPLQTINALAVYQDQIVAAGAFQSRPGGPYDNIARWDGSSWQPLGVGVNGSPYGIFSMAVHNGELYVGGSFGSAGGNTSAVCIARWDGSTWHPVGANASGWVTALGTFNGDLVASGITPPDGSGVTVGRWDGTSWHALGASPTSTSGIWSLVEFQGQLFCSGNFTLNGVANTTVARYGGSTWSALSINPSGLPDASPSAYSMLPFNDELIVSGRFTTVQGQVSANVAHWRCLCYANCDHSTAPPILSANDFQCFLNSFARGDPYANCDASTTPPILTAGDFQCFLNQFAAGCP